MVKISKESIFKNGLRFGIQKYEIKRNWKFPEHGHEGYSELLFIASGEMSVPMLGSRVLLKEGDFLFLREQDVHSLKSNEVLFYNLNFLYEDLVQAASLINVLKLVESFYLAHESPIFHLSGSLKIEIQKQMQSLFDFQRDEYGNVLLMKFLLGVLVDIVKKPEHSASFKEIPPSWFESLVFYMDDHLEGILSVLDLAHRADRSPEHVSRSFQRYFGMSPSQYRNQKRLEKASIRLASSNDEILSISLDLGFQNLNYFYKLFKKKYGMPPKEYRKMNGLGL